MANRTLAALEAEIELLKKELRLLEQKALDAIAESGQLRRQIDEMQEERVGCPEELTRLMTDHAALRRRLHVEKEERVLLTRALSQSECEIARLTRTLDQLSRQIRAA